MLQEKIAKCNTINPKTQVFTLRNYFAELLCRITLRNVSQTHDHHTRIFRHVPHKKKHQSKLNLSRENVAFLLNEWHFSSRGKLFFLALRECLANPFYSALELTPFIPPSGELKNSLFLVVVVES